MRLQTLVEQSSSPARCLDRMRVLAPHFEPGMVGAELGVFKGAFLDHLLSSKPKHLYAVDPWYRQGPQWNWADGEKSTVRALIRILDAFAEEISAGLLEPRLELSQEFLAQLPDDSLDWVYIDTTHSYKQTLIELELSCRKVKAVGIISGDDFYSDENHVHYGVYKAVTEIVTAGKLRLLVDGDHSQFVCKK
jgi:Methyltransferase domain